MTTRPRLYKGGKTAGLAALALFAVLVAVFLLADFGEMAGFGGAENITAAIGYAMFNLDAGSLPSEGFLVAFIIIAVVLDAALDAAVMLAKREEEGTLPLTDGGSEQRGTDRPAGSDEETGGDR